MINKTILTLALLTVTGSPMILYGSQLPKKKKQEVCNPNTNNIIKKISEFTGESELTGEKVADFCDAQPSFLYTQPYHDTYYDVVNYLFNNKNIAIYPKMGSYLMLNHIKKCKKCFNKISLQNIAQLKQAKQNIKNGKYRDLFVWFSSFYGLKATAQEKEDSNENTEEEEDDEEDKTND